MNDQPSLPGTGDDLGPVWDPPMDVVEDYGPIGQGTSQAISARLENGDEYLLKGPSLVPNHPQVAANELIAAKLANSLGLPLLDFRIAQQGSDLFFASSLMPTGTFMLALTEQAFNQCPNRDDVIYGLVVLDALIVNTDRHEGNLIARRFRPRGAQHDQYSLILNDHSHCLLHPGQTAADLPAKLALTPRQTIQIAYVRDAITDRDRLNRAIDAIESWSDDRLRAIVGGLPEPLLSTGDKDACVVFLTQRKAQIRQTFEGNLGDLPNLST